MIPVYIEGKKYFVDKSKNILDVCLSLGFDIPYFCWHPELGSIGSCRQCAVKLYKNDTINVHSGRLVMSCMTPVEKDMYVSIFEEELKEFRKSILELLMINHPHDCPVCEEGGNCHLQDMTVMTGHVFRRYRFTKRTHYNQYLGPFISHEMNRCITCYRCIRYYRDYAGGDDLGVFGIHDNIYFGRVQDGILENEFSGNLVEICPTGVFTDKTQSKNYTRKWDVTFAPSICQQCSVGCNIIVGERYGKLCRVENRYNGEINGYFLCDRGRFGCGYVNISNRPTNPLKQYHNNCYIKINSGNAIEDSVNFLKDSKKIIGIGSSRASIESNFALRNLVGADNFYSGVNSSEQERLLLILEILNNSGIHVPSVREIEDYDAILILGEDITQTGARVALSVRQAVKRKLSKIAESEGIFDWQSISVTNLSQNVQYPLLIIGFDRTKLDDLAMVTYYDSALNQARFCFSVAHALNSTDFFVKDFSTELNVKLNLVVQQLKKARKPLIISGSNAGSKELIIAAANIAVSLKKIKKDAGILFITQDVNSIGLAMMTDKSLDDAFDVLCADDSSNITAGSSLSRTTVIVLENDLYRYISMKRISNMLKNINYLIVLDHQYNLIQEKASLVLPVANFVESDGTVVNYEGRAQRFFRLYDPNFYTKNTEILESWRWLYLIHDAYTNCIRTEKLHLDDVINSVVYCFPELIGIKYAAPESNFRVHGQKIAQSTHRYSGRTSMHSNLNIHEPCISKNNETMFTFSMEGNHRNTKSLYNQVAFAWAPGWNSPQSWNKFQDQVGGNLYPKDPGIRLFNGVSHKNCKNNDGDIYKRTRWFDMMIPKIDSVNNENRWLIAPYWHLFGSDCMSQRTRCIQDCMPPVYAMISSLDADRFNLKEAIYVQFMCGGYSFRLPIKISVNLPQKHIGLPIGFPGVPVFFLGMYVESIEGFFKE
nr:NADH-quinone oxidoreductase subunit NuoG [Candidatus Blochmannia vafer]